MMYSYVINICDRLLAGSGKAARQCSWLALITGISRCGCIGLPGSLRCIGKARHKQPAVDKVRHSGAHRIADRPEPQEGGNLLASSRCATKVQQAFVLHRELMYSCVAQGDAKGRVTLELRHGKPVFLHGTAHDGNSPGAVFRKIEIFLSFAIMGL